MNRDLARQLWVTVCEVACIVGTLVGVGVLGTRVEESSGGSLAADATLLAPAGPAFSIWSVIYLGLFAYTIWQWLPAQRTSPRHRSIGWLAGVSMLLNAGWLLVTQQGWIWVSVVVIVALAIVLGLILRRLTEHSEGGLPERIIVDGTFGLYVGWVSVATCANIAAAGASSGITAGMQADQWIAVGVLVVAAALGFLLAVRLGSRIAIALAMAWGLAWIAVGRLTDEPASGIVGVAAIVAAVLALSAPLITGRFRPESV